MHHCFFKSSPGCPLVLNIHLEHSTSLGGCRLCGGLGSRLEATNSKDRNAAVFWSNSGCLKKCLALSKSRWFHIKTHHFPAFFEEIPGYLHLGTHGTHPWKEFPHSRWDDCSPSQQTSQKTWYQHGYDSNCNLTPTGWIVGRLKKKLIIPKWCIQITDSPKIAPGLWEIYQNAKYHPKTPKTSKLVWLQPSSSTYIWKTPQKENWVSAFGVLLWAL